MIEDRAKPINLTSDEATLSAELSASLATEVRYAATFGSECELKWKREHRLNGGARLSCFTCPHYTDDELHDLAPICVLGRQQETITAQLEALAGHGSLDDELAEAFERHADAAEELAEAMLA